MKTTHTAGFRYHGAQLLLTHVLWGVESGDTHTAGSGKGDITCLG